MSARRSTKAVHLQGVKDALALCGFDWMASLPRSEAVPLDRRGKATCKRCLAIAATLDTLDNAPTLNDVLASLGWRTEARHNALGQGKHVFDADGNDLGDMTASETWKLLRERGLHPKKES
jgi:hypothetical protein